MRLIVIQNIGPRYTLHGFIVSYDWSGVRMALVTDGEQFIEELSLRVVFTHLDLFKDDLPFFFNLISGKGRILHGFDE